MGGDFCFDDHVNKVTRTAFCHLKNMCQKLEHSFLSLALGPWIAGIFRMKQSQSYMEI